MDRWIDRQHNIESSMTDRQRLIDRQMDKDNNISQKVSTEMGITLIKHPFKLSYEHTQLNLQNIKMKKQRNRETEKQRNRETEK
jgi:hypothetical protein